MTTQISHFINGRRTDVMDPNTGQVQGKAPMASAADVDAAVAGAAEAQKEWAAWNPQRRARVMMRFIDLVNQNVDELAETLSLEHGNREAAANNALGSKWAQQTPQRAERVAALLRGY